MSKKAKLVKLRLVLDVDFDPQGETVESLKDNLRQVVRDATNNGTLSGSSPATVELYEMKITKRR